jgi:hypothetical protein
MGSQLQRQYVELLNAVCEKVAATEVLLAYDGEVTQGVTRSLSQQLEALMDQEQEAATVRKRVYHVAVESLQNISKHAAVQDSAVSGFSGLGAFVVCRNSECYHVISGNAVTKDKRENLEQKLQKVNSLDHGGLNQLYKTQMLNGGELSEKGGAGLGFIDMARKTGHSLMYEFHAMDEQAEMEFFIMTSTIPRT